MTGAVTIAAIVEGEGEVAALPVLLRRIACELSVWDVRIPTPRRVPRSKLVGPGGVENAVLQASYQVDGRGGILLLVDADDDCPATTGPELLRRARQARGDREMAAVLANREFEAWFLAAAPSLAGCGGLADPLEPPADPEAPRDAKGWLSGRKTDGTSYRPTADQAALAGAFDMVRARKNAPSFDKFWRDMERLMLGGS